MTIKLALRPLKMVTTSQTHARFGLVLLAAAFMAGILLNHWIQFSRRSFVVAALVFTLLVAVAVLSRAVKIAGLLLSLAFLTAGFVLSNLEKQAHPLNTIRTFLDSAGEGSVQLVEIEGTVERNPEIARERRHLDLSVKRIRVNSVVRDVVGRVRVLMIVSPPMVDQVDGLQLRYGARIRMLAVLDRADKFRNPGVSPFSDYLDRRGYDASAFVKNPVQVERLSDDRVFLPLALIYDLRSALQRSIDTNFSKHTAGLLDATLLGNRHNLTAETAESFRVGGTFHILVISGLHITFLGGLAFLIVRRITRNRLVQFLGSTALVWGYALAVGMESSVSRAALMFTFVVLAPLIARKALSLNVLGAVAILLLAGRPSTLIDPSFQLTFVSVLAIVGLAWPILEKMSAIGRWHPTRATPYPPACSPLLQSLCECLFWGQQKAQRDLELSSHQYRLFKAPAAATLERIHLQTPLRYIVQALIVSAAVQLFLLPFLVVYTHRLSPASFILNIVVSLLIAGTSASAAAALLVQQLNASLAAPLFSLTEVMNWLMVGSVEPFESTRLASIRLPEYSGAKSIVYAVYYIPLLVLTLLVFRWEPFRSGLRRTRFRIAGWASFALLALGFSLVILHPGSAADTAGKLRVDFLDVGQGDSALVTLPDTTTILIDGGGEPGPFNRTTTEDDPPVERRRIGEAVVSEYLWWRGLDSIDYLVATHADADHIDGLNDIAKNFEVRAALVARTPSIDVQYADFFKTATSRKIPIRMIGAGDQIEVGGATLNVYWPPASENLKLSSANNDSVVLQIRYGGRTILLTGDIESKAENALLKSGMDLTSDVVKLAHHGSKTSSSSAFIAATNARLGVISVGQRSMFGHPHADVVERWQQSGAQLLTTGRSGTISIVTDGKNLNIETFINAGRR